jgi:uncharacterized membrane protein
MSLRAIGLSPATAGAILGDPTAIKLQGVGHGVAGEVNGVMSLAAPRRRRLPDFL